MATNRQGETVNVINCLGVMEAEIGPSLSSHGAWLESGWIGSAYKRWMVFP